MRMRTLNPSIFASSDDPENTEGMAAERGSGAGSVNHPLTNRGARIEAYGRFYKF